MANSDLKSKYGDAALQAGRKLQGEAFERRLEQRDSLDQHFTKSWVDFAITGISQRSQLDTRTRLLVLVGQYTMASSERALDETMRAALDAKVHGTRSARDHSAVRGVRRTHRRRSGDRDVPSHRAGAAACSKSSSASQLAARRKRPHALARRGEQDLASGRRGRSAACRISWSATAGSRSAAGSRCGRAIT